MKSKYNEEYLNYLIGEVGLLSDYDLHEIGITYEQYYNPDDEVLYKVEEYINKKKRN